ncbi:MAG: SRPBCC family protein [Alphaproteobacteria bacterium]|jgi:hypothetical protein|nr:SRPBCC family protein [Alphaproteobacteria bacterium]
MSSVSVTRTIAVAPDTAWQEIRSVGGLERWVPIVQTCEVEGSGVGAVRKCGLGEGAFVFEKVESIDEAQRVFTYSITESPLPLENYMGRMQIGPGADGGSEITWSCEFACDSAAEAEMTAMLEGAFSDGLAGLQSLLG